MLVSGFNLFNNEQRSGYEELLSYYPIFYKDIREMNAILHISGSMLDGMASAMEEVVLNRFIDTMDEETTSRWETFLYLTANRNRPLEERKHLIHALLIGHGKISASKIKEVVKVFTGLTAEVEFIRECLTVKVPLDGEYQFLLSDIKNLFKKRIPAHLALLMIGKFHTTIEQQIQIETELTIKSEFYPRYNLKPLILDNTWFLNDLFSLNGYYTNEVLDFYPFYLTITNETLYEVKAENRISFENKGKPEISYHAEQTIVNKLTETEQYESYFKQQNQIEPIIEYHSELTIEKDLWFLNGSMILDGSRLLDADIFIMEL